MNRYVIGQASPRLEDRRFLTGQGRYMSDVRYPGEAQAFIIRSPHASAEIVSIDAGKANSMPGVLAVFSAADLGDELGLTSISFKRTRPDGTPMFWRSQPALSRNRVRYVGEPVAFVVAETLAQAKDAAEAVVTDYRADVAVVDIAEALGPSSCRVWADCPDNVSNITEQGDKRSTEIAFARAKHVVKRRYVVSRVHAQYMEPRSAVGSFDAAERQYTLYCDVQSPHQIRDILSEEVLKVGTEQLRVVSRDIGGAFGGKAGAVEHRLILWAARRLGRPVRWEAERSETMLSDEHGRDNVHDVELALDDEFRFIALRSHWIANVGAYISADRNFQTSFINTPGMIGVYRIPFAYVRSTCVMTNTGPLAPYRGAGRPEATYVIERIIDDAAAEFGIDRVDIRKRNILRPDELPIRTALGYLYDCGDFPKCMDMACQFGDWQGFAARQRLSREKGLIRGIGLANPIERAGAPGIEYAEIRVDRYGKATVLVGTKNHGQGHETAFAQIIGTHLGLSPENIHFIDGDTDRVAYGNGTFGSRSASIGGTAVAKAAEKIVEKGKELAAHLLESAAEDIQFDHGKFIIAGTDRSVSFENVARAAYDPRGPRTSEPALIASASFVPTDCTFPYGTHVCEVEIDPDTGVVRIDRYFLTDDLGQIINPLIVKGQLHGGIAQGAAQALAERMLYDVDSGQCVTGSFMDYAMLRASDICNFEISNFTTISDRNPLGVKGVGEAGTVGALAAVMSAVNHALSTLGAQPIDMPATPDRVWLAIRDTRAQQA